MAKVKESRLHITVRNTPGYKRNSLYKCAVNKPSVSAEVCRALSSNPDNNIVCKNTNCASLWRACDFCITGGNVSSQETQINKDTNLCFMHASELEKLDKATRGRGRGKNGEASPPEKKKIVKSLNDVLQQVMSTAEPPCDLMADSIQRFADQPRLSFNKSSLIELGESLKVVQIMPVFVRRLTKEEISANGGKCQYELVDGERRWRACKVVHKTEIRAIILDIPNKATQFAISAIANFGREDHTPLEEAMAIRFMREEFNLSVAEIASSYAKSEVWVYQRLKLLDLVPEVQKMLMESDEYKKPLKIGIAMLLADLIKDNPDLQKKAAKHLVSHPDMTSKSADRYIQSLLEEEGIEAPARRKYKIQGPVHTRSRLNMFVNKTWDTLDSLLKVPDLTYVSLPIDDETRSSIRNNLHAMSRKLVNLAERI